MSPSSEISRKSLDHYSSLGLKEYEHRSDYFFVSGDVWLEDRRKVDNTKGLWRVHDDLYDLTDFIDKHPGGKIWLELTKGTDITEAFESHHISEKPEKILSKFHIEKATTSRNSPFTFDENGFYRTLKKNVRDILPNLPKHANLKSKIIIDILLLAYIGMAILTAIKNNYFFAVLSGLFLSLLTTAAHSYIHKKDSFRMHYFNMSFMSTRDWRISHALSHHLFPNTIIDMEVQLCEPLLQYLPGTKHFVFRYISWLYSPLFYVALFPIFLLRRVVKLLLGESRHLAKTDLIPFIVPMLMYIFGNQTVGQTIFLWTLIILSGSAYFAFNGLLAHHGIEVFHDGDEPRTKPTIDWGIYQLDSAMDRILLTKSLFMSFTHFGDHTLHHLFPTLDQGVLNYLYPIVEKTCIQFGVEIQKKSDVEIIKDQFKQIAKIESKNIPYGKKVQ